LENNPHSKTSKKDYDKNLNLDIAGRINAYTSKAKKDSKN